MILTWRDAVSTILTGASAAAYGVHIADSGLTARMSAVAVLVLGAAAAAVAHSRILIEGAAKPTFIVIAVLISVAVAAAANALTAGGGAALILLVGCVMGLWALAIVRHLRAGRVTDRELREFLDRGRADGRCG